MVRVFRLVQACLPFFLSRYLHIQVSYVFSLDSLLIRFPAISFCFTFFFNALMLVYVLTFERQSKFAFFMPFFDDCYSCSILFRKWKNEENVLTCFPLLFKTYSTYSFYVTTK